MPTILMGYDVEAAAIGEGLARFTGVECSQYLPALEPESTALGLELMTEVHSELGVPGTLFICGRTLVHALDAVRLAQREASFDLQQHTYSHLVFREVRYSPGPGVEGVIQPSPPVAMREELALTSRLIEDHLGPRCVGLRTPFGYYRGLRDRPDLLEILRDSGIRYASSWLRNEDGDNPTPWV